ncbi:nucleolar and spindle-associated protein 1-B-like isoform X2 [Cheilinus undulatus]|uniref:nucleolar and spindle-associated protein 1-B-like isoform X2 n=1 Tax=Cheilinus undulatus TaxID=241271 RepID=UPI001BD36691|nr:nucleolar and spindle-associated protein 1-B-like isoform X2 [Cheilinus undulatus]
MFWRFAALSLIFLLLLVQGRNLNLTDVQYFSSPWEFGFPEIDGSPVNTCGIPSASTLDITTTTTVSTTTTTKTTPVTRKVVTTIKKPTIQSSPRKAQTRKNVTPIRPMPAPSAPITNRHSNPSLNLLYQLLTNSRRHQGGSTLRFRNLSSQPMGGRPHRGQRAERKRWKMGSSSSEDSSD